MTGRDSWEAEAGCSADRVSLPSAASSPLAALDRAERKALSSTGSALERHKSCAGSFILSVALPSEEKRSKIFSRFPCVTLYFVPPLFWAVHNSRKTWSCSPSSLTFFLPKASEALAAFPALRTLCCARPRLETVTSAPTLMAQEDGDGRATGEVEVRTGNHGRRTSHKGSCLHADCRIADRRSGLVTRCRTRKCRSFCSVLSVARFAFFF